MKDRPLSEWWVSEWHPDGSIKATPLADVIQRNGAGFLEGKSPGFVLLGINPTMEGALEHGRHMKRLRRHGHEEGAGDSEAGGADVPAADPGHAEHGGGLAGGEGADGAPSDGGAGETLGD